MNKKFTAVFVCAVVMFFGLSITALAEDRSSSGTQENILNSEPRFFDSLVWLPLDNIPAGSVIYTPKSFDKKAYNTISSSKRQRITNRFYFYFYNFFNYNSAGNGEERSPPNPEWPISSPDNTENWDIKVNENGDTYADILCGYEAMYYQSPTSSDYNAETIPRYGLAIYYKDRGESKREEDKKVLKKFIDSYEGPACRVLLVPRKYAMNDLLKITKDIRKLIGGKARCKVSARRVLLYLPDGLKNNPKVQEYLTKNHCEDIVNTVTVLNWGT